MRISKTKKLAMCLVTILASTILFGCAKAVPYGLYACSWNPKENAFTDIKFLHRQAGGEYEMVLPLSMANGLLVSFAERSVDDDGEEVREPLEITSAGEVVLQDDTETFLPEQNKAAVTATYCSAVKSGMSARFVHFFCNRPLLFAAVDTKKATRDQTVAEKRLFQRAAQAQVTLERWETASFPLLLTAGETGRCYRVNLKLCR